MMAAAAANVIGWRGGMMTATANANGNTAAMQTNNGNGKCKRQTTNAGKCYAANGDGGDGDWIISVDIGNNLLLR